MTNFEKHKTAQEREKKFWKWNKQNIRDNFTAGQFVSDAFAWLELEAEEEKPLPCPFCGGKSFIHEASRKKHFAFCRCGYTSSVHKTESEAIAAHNRVAKAVKESEAK